jgi:hypothetical protein
MSFLWVKCWFNWGTCDPESHNIQASQFFSVSVGSSAWLTLSLSLLLRNNTSYSTLHNTTSNKSRPWTFLMSQRGHWKASSENCKKHPMLLWGSVRRCNSISFATVTTVTPDCHSWNLLNSPIILSLYTTQCTHKRPWTHKGTLVLMYAQTSI